MKVKDVMHQQVNWQSPDTPLTELAKIMKKDDIGSIPIGEDDRLVGMVTDRDIAIRGVAEGRDPAKCTARDVMTKGIVYCMEDEEVDDAIRVMEDKQIRRLPVINAKKRMVGMLSLGDVSHSASQSLTGELTKAVSAHH